MTLSSLSKSRGDRRSWSPWVALIVLLYPLAWSPALVAQEMVVPLEVQFALFFKIILFDRNLDCTGQPELTLGILYQEKFRPSLLAKEAATEMLASNNDDGLPLRLRPVPIKLSAAVGLEPLLPEGGIDLLYVAPLRAVNLDSVIAVCRRRRIRTFTGVPAYVESGIAVGVGAKGEKPEILINMSAAKAEGSDFNAQLLKIATVYGR